MDKLPSPHSIARKDLFRDAAIKFFPSRDHVGVQETDSEAVLTFPKGQFDVSNLSINILVDETTGRNVLHIADSQNEKFLLLSDSVDICHLSSMLDDGILTIIAPKKSPREGEPCFRSIQVYGEDVNVKHSKMGKKLWTYLTFDVALKESGHYVC